MPKPPPGSRLRGDLDSEPADTPAGHEVQQVALGPLPAALLGGNVPLSNLTRDRRSDGRQLQIESLPPHGTRLAVLELFQKTLRLPRPRNDGHTRTLWRLPGCRFQG